VAPTRLPVESVREALTLEGKGPGREANHTPPYSAELKNEWSYTITSPYVSMSCTRTNLPLSYVLKYQSSLQIKC
jgi:hypothetical protein